MFSKTRTLGTPHNFWVCGWWKSLEKKFQINICLFSSLYAILKNVYIFWSISLGHFIKHWNCWENICSQKSFVCDVRPTITYLQPKLCKKLWLVAGLKVYQHYILSFDIWILYKDSWALMYYSWKVFVESFNPIYVIYQFIF